MLTFVTILPSYWHKVLTARWKDDKYYVCPGKTNESDMQQKQKVTLYLPPGLHRQLKIKAAIEEESMSAMVQRAIGFYLKYPEKVEEQEPSHGRTHQIHICPECEAAMVMREGEMVSLKSHKSLVSEDFPIEVEVTEKVETQTNSQGEEELVPC